mgnify:FL=1
MDTGTKIVNLVQQYNSLTPIGQALCGFKIIEKIDNLIIENKLEGIRDSIKSWLWK